jgi:hypothetical protein
MLVVPFVVTTLLARFSAPSPGGIGRLGLKLSADVWDFQLSRPS